MLILLHFQAYDQHLNMILSEVEETITTVEIDEETYEELFKVTLGTGRTFEHRAYKGVITKFGKCDHYVA